MKNTKHPILIELQESNRIILKVGQIEIDIISNGDSITAEMKDVTDNSGDVLAEMSFDWEA